MAYANRPHRPQRKLRNIRKGNRSRIQVKTDAGWLNSTAWPYDNEGRIRKGFRVNW